jgi:preprotein translocase subunit SecG
MSVMFSVTLTVHILVGLTVIGLVLLQHGKGADMGAAFGSGASGSLFGASGSANFLSRATAVLATVFFITSLTLAYMAGKRPAVEGSSVMDTVKTESSVPAPATATATEKTATVPTADSKDKDLDSKVKDVDSKVKDGDSKTKDGDSKTKDGDSKAKDIPK